MSNLLIPGMVVHNVKQGGQAYSAEEAQAHFAYIEQLQPSSMVYMDTFGWARQAKKILPNCHVVHRRYFEYDLGGGKKFNEGSIWQHEKFQNKFTRDWMYDLIAADGEAGVIVHVLNEPDGYGDLPALVDWLVPLYERLGKAGIAFCGPNFGVGHPAEHRLDELAPLFEVYAQFPGMAFHGVHEYWSYLGVQYGAGRVGRFEKTVNYLTSAGKPVPDMIVTEFGIDHIDSSGKRGWRDSRTEEQYAAEAEEALTQYRKFKCIVGATFFAKGATGADWYSHDIHNAQVLEGKLLTRAQELRQEIPAPPPSPEAPLPTQKPPINDDRWKAYIARVPGNVLTRVRREPWVTASVLTTIPVGVSYSLKHIPQEKLRPEEVAYQDNDPKGFWSVIKIGGHIGYIRNDVVTLTPDAIVLPPAPPETAPPPDTYTKAEVDLLINIALNAERVYTKRMIDDAVKAALARLFTVEVMAAMETQGAVRVAKAG